MTTETTITPRQLELLAKICSGLPINKAAADMFIAPKTAYNILAAARRNADAGTNEHLVVIALQAGWLEMDDEGTVAPVALSQN